MIFIFLGTAFSLGGLVTPETGEALLHPVAEVALVILLFLDAAQTDWTALRHRSVWPRRMLLIGLPTTIAIGAVAAALLFPAWSIAAAALAAAILAPTDAALGQAVVTNEAVPIRPRRALTVESGLNDGICVPVLFLLIAVFVSQSGEDLSSFYGLSLLGKEIGIGILAGCFISFFGFRLIQYSSKRQWLSESWNTMIIVALAFSCFALAQISGGSGFIACFAGGFLYGILRRKSDLKVELIESAEGTGDTFGLITWLLFGSLVIAAFIHELSWQVVAYALLSLTVIRMLPVALSLIKSGVSGKEKLFMGWFGPRGLASIVFAIIVLDEGVPEGAFIALVVACTVFLSLVVHGVTANPLARRMAALESRE